MMRKWNRSKSYSDALDLLAGGDVKWKPNYKYSQPEITNKAISEISLDINLLHYSVRHSTFRARILCNLSTSPAEYIHRHSTHTPEHNLFH